MSASLFCAKGLHFDYPNFSLKGVDLNIGVGEIVGFIGANGAGKTTTIRCLSGQIRPKSGEISLDGCFLQVEPNRYKAMVGYVCEDTDIYDNLTADQFVRVFKPFYNDWDE